VVSAGSAGGYLAGEINLPFSVALLTVMILVLFSCICLLGIRESSRVALGIFLCHLGTMVILAVTAIVRWGMNGNAVLSSNWHTAQPSSVADIIKQIFFGASLGFLGNTGMLLCCSVF
jgi:amino acid transporter